MAAAAGLTLMAATGTWGAGSVGAGLAAVPEAYPALERQCAAAAVAYADATPAAIYVQGRISGSSTPQVQLWAGGAHLICQPTVDGGVAFRPKPRGTGIGFQNIN
jgi:hypothetical protein